MSFNLFPADCRLIQFNLFSRLTCILQISTYLSVLFIRPLLGPKSTYIRSNLHQHEKYQVTCLALHGTCVGFGMDLGDSCARDGCGTPAIDIKVGQHVEIYTFVMLYYLCRNRTARALTLISGHRLKSAYPTKGLGFVAGGSPHVQINEQS